jgi:hypothetical protein
MNQSEVRNIELLLPAQCCTPAARPASASIRRDPPVRSVGFVDVDFRQVDDAASRRVFVGNDDP